MDFKKEGLSLVELMVTLIIISCIVGALTPMITKKLKSQGITVGSGGGGSASVNVDVNTECDSYSNCALCTSEKCVLCKDGICASNEYINHDDCSCKSCTEFNSNCVECQTGGCLRCNSGYEFNNGSCSECPIGYYCDGEIKQACQSGYYQDEVGQTSCKSCASKIENCASCNSETGECEECKAGYSLSNGVCSDYNCGDLAVGITINGEKYCMTKYNMGDNETFKLPDNITIATAGVDTCTPSESNFCCWQGTTSTSCNAENGGYSGCNRTVCDWRAANRACGKLEYLGKDWRLPTSTEWTSIGNQINDISIGQGSSGLMLCDSNSGYSSSHCLENTNCPSAYDNKCSPDSVWGANATCYQYIEKGSPIKINTTTYSFAFSTRCIAKADSVRPTSPCENADCGELAMCIELSDTKAICMTKYNIGDKTELAIGTSNVITVTAGSGSCDSTSKACCFSGNTSASCDKADNTYSGCTRTVCNLRAAGAMCHFLNYNNRRWRLPTSLELNSLTTKINDVSINQYENGLMLCDLSAGYGSSKCETSQYCTGVNTNNYCGIAAIWDAYSADGLGHGYYLQNGVLNSSFTSSPNSVLSVRCVSDL